MVNHQKIALENNLGVSSLEAGDLRMALEHFSETLCYNMSSLGPSHSKQHTNGSPKRPVADPPVSVRGRGGCSSSTDARSETTTSATITTTASRPLTFESLPKTPPSSATFAYTRGINLIPHPTAYSPDSLINNTIVSSIIIFNMSLVYHLKGLDGTSLSMLRLRKAQALYRKSHCLLVDAGVPLSATGNPVIDVLSMALYNNLAHVAYELKAYGESRNLFDYLVRFALTVVPSRYGDAFVGTMLEQQKSSFLLNAIILQEPKFAAAA